MLARHSRRSHSEQHGAQAQKSKHVLSVSSLAHLTPCRTSRYPHTNRRSRRIVAVSHRAIECRLAAATRLARYCTFIQVFTQSHERPARLREQYARRDGGRRGVRAAAGEGLERCERRAVRSRHGAREQTASGDASAPARSEGPRPRTHGACAAPNRAQSQA
jgi:hypothetical protein